MPKSTLFSIRDIFADRRKLTVFVVCLTLAAFSWMLIALGNQYSTTLLVPVKYINFPENKTLLNQVPDRLAVNVRGNGFDLIKIDDKLTEDTLDINLDNLKLSALGDYVRGHLDKSELGKELQKRISGGLAINNVISDSIVFVFDLKVSRVLPIKSRLTYQVENGYAQIDSLRTNPSEVEVYGALTILDTMQAVYTERTEIGLLNKSVAQNAKIDLSQFGNNVTASVDSVRVEIEIDQLTEKRFMIPPVQINVPDSIELITFPDGIEVIANVPMRFFDDIEIKDFELQVDYSEREKGYMVLPVHLVYWNPKVENVRLNPSNVEIVIKSLQ